MALCRACSPLSDLTLTRNLVLWTMVLIEASSAMNDTLDVDIAVGIQFRHLAEHFAAGFTKQRKMKVQKVAAIQET